MITIVATNLHPSKRGIMLDEKLDRLFPVTWCCGAKYMRDPIQRGSLNCSKCRAYLGVFIGNEYWAGKPLHSHTSSIEKSVANWLGYAFTDVSVKITR